MQRIAIDKQLLQMKQRFAMEMYQLILSSLHPQKIYSEKEIGLLEELAELNEIDTRLLWEKYVTQYELLQRKEQEEL